MPAHADRRFYRKLDLAGFREGGKFPSSLNVTIMFTGFHSILDLSYGISELMVTGCLRDPKEC